MLTSSDCQEESPLTRTCRKRKPYILGCSNLKCNVHLIELGGGKKEVLFVVVHIQYTLTFLAEFS